MGEPTVSVVVPARDEAASLPATLRSLRALETDVAHEVVVADGDSEDATPAVAREFGARVVPEGGESIARGRNAGARAARGDWLAFVDADTRVRPGYLDAMLAFVERAGLVGASSRCRMVGTRRAKPMEWTINRVFPRLTPPILPGFNLFVDADRFREWGGFPDVPNEDTAFSRAFGRAEPTAYHPEVLVESSARRIAEHGLTGTAWHYLRLDWRRLRADD